jgi:hypothetical protein
VFALSNASPTVGRLVAVSAALAVASVAAGCVASQPAPPSSGELPGFLLGFWHGLIGPIAFLISLFDESVRIYAFPNVGRWYDFGFMLGIGGFTGGAGAASRSARAGKERTP